MIALHSRLNQTLLLASSCGFCCTLGSKHVTTRRQ